MDSTFFEVQWSAYDFNVLRSEDCDPTSTALDLSNVQMRVSSHRTTGFERHDDVPLHSLLPKNHGIPEVRIQENILVRV